MSAIRDRNTFPDPPLSRRDVLQPMAATLWGNAHWPMFCANCQAALLAIDEEESKWVWGNLPAMFAMTFHRDTWPGILADRT